ncbi:hypothetical protein [Marinobacter adhaerens]|uniref:hypothetical protein n=1 Tax=Marinobacter adhaerens TaxID=1033846 RepID=UPI001E593732|nr:hypothetical protein [Marinobacter adhaerens]MCD1645753.1 hypothetical protein [Marinobacter adhaerens]
MGRRTKIMPTPELMGVVACRKLRESVIGVKEHSFIKLNLKSSHWERLSTRQKFTAANITINRSTTAYFLTINLSSDLVSRLNDPHSAQSAFEYIRDRLNRSFKAIGEAKPSYWYVLENLNKHASCRNTFNYGFSTAPNVDPHIHAGFGLQNPSTSIEELKAVLRKNLGGGRHKAVDIRLQGTRHDDGTIEQKTLAGMIGSPRYACKNLGMNALDGIPRPFVLSRALQQATLSTLRWLSS